MARASQSLYTKLLLLVLMLLVVSSIASLTAVITATNSNIERQANTRLSVGGSVLESLLDARGQQLLESAEVLTADFGFKQAVALRDINTLASVLENHGARINADVLTLFDLEGNLLASTSTINDRMQKQAVFSYLKEGGGANGLQANTTLDGMAYQLVLVQVRAPTPVAWAMIGFEINSAFVRELKDMTLLDLSFANVASGGSNLLVSTLPSTVRQQIANWSGGVIPQSDNYNHLPVSLKGATGLSVLLSVSLEEERARFEILKRQIIAIGAIVLFCSLAILVPMLRGITRPIQGLVLGAKRVSGGDYGSQIKADSRSVAEIEQLAQSFNEMQTAIAAREEQIVHQAQHDNLTGLPLRDKVSVELNSTIHFLESNEQLAIVSMSVQRIKSINNSLGFAIGDKLLCACAHRLTLNFPEPHVVGRSTASEFVLLYYLGENESTAELSARLHQQWAEPFDIDSFSINVPLTLGIAHFPSDGNQAEGLLRRSDIALNRALELRHQTEFYIAGEDQKHLKQIQLINDLKYAMQSNQLTLYYQPKVNVEVGGVTEVEALVRWVHPELGFIAPDEFIGLAEQSGLMPLLSRWILERGVQDACTWRAMGYDISVAINLSAYDLVHDDLPVYVSKLLEEKNYSSKRLILEVTESAMMEDPDKALQVLHQFRKLGATLAIDDYGTGYSSLGQMKQLPVNELKIDMCFVRNLSSDASDQVIVKSTIAMAHNIGLKVVAEGVEDEQSQAMLEAWGCDKLQGYLFSKPLPLDELLQWLPEFSYQRAAAHSNNSVLNESSANEAHVEQQSRRAS